MRTEEKGDAGYAHPLRDACAVLLILALTVVFFARVLFSSSPVILGSSTLVDLTHQFYPWRLFGFSLLGEGIVPLWNPYLFCGYPFIENWQSAIFYPLNLVFLVMSTRAAINASFILHVFLTGVFTYYFVRCIGSSRFGALVSSLIFMFSTTVILRIFSGHLTIICTLPWFPAQLLAVEKGLQTRRSPYFVLGGIALGMQILAGHPQYVLYSLIGVILYTIFRGISIRGAAGSTLLFFLLYLGVGVGLSAIQLLPGLEYVRYSLRGQMLTLGEATGGSFPPENLITFLLPAAFGDFINLICWGRCYLWEAAVYVGIVPLVLLAMGCAYRELRGIVSVFCLLGAISLVMAMGGYTPLLNYVYRYVPGFNLIRGNAKLLFLTVFCISVVAGLGARGMVGDLRRRRAMLLTLLCVVIAAMLLTYAAYAAGGQLLWNRLLQYRKGIEADYWGRLDDPFFLMKARMTFVAGIGRLAVFLGFTAVIILCALVRRVPSSLIKIVLIAVIVSDLWGFDALFLPISPVSSCEWPTGAVAFFKGDPGIYRIMRDIRVHVPGVNQGMNHGLQSFEGYETNTLARYNTFAEYFHVRSEEAEKVMDGLESSRMASLANIKYLILPPATVSLNPDWRPKYANGYVKIFENRNVLPRAWIVHRYTVVGDSRQACAQMQERGFEPRREVVLEGEPGIAIHPAPPRSEATIVRYEPLETVIDCRLEEAGILVVSDAYYPGWKVSVDGVPGRIIPADCMFRGVPLEKGMHEVRFSYEPAAFRIGAWISVFSVAATVCYLSISVLKGRGRGIHLS